VWRQILLFGMAFANLFLHRYESVIPLAREAGELMPDLRPYCAAAVASALGHLGRLDAARATITGVDIAAQGAMLAGFAAQDRDTVMAGIGQALADAV
jgi:hypothetical protein